MNWLFDHRTMVYLLLATLFIVFLAVWWQSRKRIFGILSIVVLVLAVLFATIDVFIRRETDREQLQRKVRELAQSVGEPQKMDGVADHISTNVKSKKGLTKSEFLKAVAALSKQYEVRDIKISDIRNINIDRDNKTASLRFNATANSGQSDRTWTVACEAEFVLEDDDEWRFQSYRLFFPANSTDELLLQELP